MGKTRGRQATDRWAEAVSHLRGVDPRWNALIDRLGPCELRPRPRPDWFGTLVRAIISQQISTHAAKAIDGRLRNLAGERHEPAALLALAEETLRGIGISGVKARYIRNLAEAVQTKTVALHTFQRHEDEAIVAALTSIKGIGVWTAEMFLIFSLARPDVLPVGDLGIRMAIRDWFELAEMPTPTQCRELTVSWRPYRSIASWYLWRAKDTRNPDASGTSQPQVSKRT